MLRLCAGVIHVYVLSLCAKAMCMLCAVLCMLCAGVMCLSYTQDIRFELHQHSYNYAWPSTNILHV